MPRIKLESSDHIFFEVDVKIARSLGIIRKILPEIKVCTSFSFEAIVPLPLISSNVLGRLLDWTVRHCDDLPEELARKAVETDFWKKELLVYTTGTGEEPGAQSAQEIKANKELLNGLIFAAEYLEIDGLCGCYGLQSSDESDFSDREGGPESGRNDPVSGNSTEMDDMEEEHEPENDEHETEEDEYEQLFMPTNSSRRRNGVQWDFTR